MGKTQWIPFESESTLERAVFNSKNFKAKIVSLIFACSILFASLFAVPLSAQIDTAQADNTILIKNVSIFDGTAENLITGRDVVVVGNKIEKLIPSGGPVTDFDQVIDGQGGYLTPGLIDAHVHAWMGSSVAETFGQPLILTSYVTAMEMQEMLLRGVTTVRDTAGPTMPLRTAIDQGNIPGPRVYPSGAMITMYGGHMDYRNPNDLARELGGPKASMIEQMKIGFLANGPEEVRVAARQQLSQGATQIKLSTSGSVTGVADPIDVVEYTSEEISAAVEAAADFGTYVAVHSYNTEGVRRSLEAGVLSIEHGNLIDEATMKLLVKKGAFMVPQIWSDRLYLKQGLQKAQVVIDGTAATMALAKKHGAKVVFGTDLLFDLEQRKTQLQELIARKDFFSSPEIMIQATGTAGKLLALSGNRNPYGKLGVVEPGAMADLLIYDKNPLRDVAIAAEPESNLEFIMKDGKIYKNTL